MATTTGLMYPPIRAVSAGAVALIQFCPPPDFDSQFLPAAREETGATRRFVKLARRRRTNSRGHLASAGPRRLPVPAR
jgi:hypothetical protein